MIQFPKSTFVGRPIPKEAFYKGLVLNSELKAKFVSDIRRITIENSLTADTLHMEAGAEVKEIVLLAIDLKKAEFDYRVIESIARQNARKLIFLLRLEDKGQLAVYFNKLYKSELSDLNALELEAKGFNLDELWSGFVEQIALRESPALVKDSGDLVERLQKQETILKLQKQIDVLEKQARKEKQPKRRFELAMQVQQLKKELGAI